MAGRVTRWIEEAGRRRVFRTTGVYLVGVWAISQGAVELAPLFGAPDWMLRAGLIAVVAFTPAVVVLAWMFDIGRDGIVRDPQDVVATKLGDPISQMPTQLGNDVSKGAIVVRWEEQAVGGGNENPQFAFVEDFFLGRASDCRVRFYDPLVSRLHARVFYESGSWHIEDLGSRNGTKLSGVSIDRVVLGRSSEAQLNEAGPSLTLDLIEPGEETTLALAKMPVAGSVAHVRSDSLPATGTSRARTAET